MLDPYSLIYAQGMECRYQLTEEAKKSTCTFFCSLQAAGIKQLKYKQSQIGHPYTE